MPKQIGPGPGAYLLPSTIGYEKHDPSRYRNPQYTMRAKCPFGGKPLGPGPKYNVDKITRNGKISPPAYSLALKLKPLTPFKTPGPGAYSPEKMPRMKDQRPPAYSISPRYAPLRKFNTPGPNQYIVPSTLGPRVPNKPAAAAYSMSAKHDLKMKDRSPGPAKYPEITPDLYKNRNPLYTMRPRVGLKGKALSPGPAAYLPAFKDPIPGGISFGRRVDRQPYITAEDHMPCAD